MISVFEIVKRCLEIGAGQVGTLSAMCEAFVHATLRDGTLAKEHVTCCGLAAGTVRLRSPFTEATVGTAHANHRLVHCHSFLWPTVISVHVRTLVSSPLLKR